jgi:hypothetical protein
MVHAAGYGATFVLAMTCAAVSFVCYAFVDDTDLVHTQPGNHCGSELIPEIQGAIDHWEEVSEFLAVLSFPRRVTGIWWISSGGTVPGDTAQ